MGDLAATLCLINEPKTTNSERFKSGHCKSAPGLFTAIYKGTTTNFRASVIDILFPLFLKKTIPCHIVSNVKPLHAVAAILVFRSEQEI